MIAENIKNNFDTVSNQESVWEDDAWIAECHLSFKVKGDKTVLHEKKTRGPLVVQRPFYPEGDLCHVYLLHPPGGIVGGDVLNTSVCVVEYAGVLMTTPGASKLYRTKNKPSIQHTEIQLEQGSFEWFPQESIIFNGAQSTSLTQINLTSQSTFIGWEILCLGRPAAHELFEQGNIKFRFNIFRNGVPIVRDQLKIYGNDIILQAPWGLAGYTCSATFIATGVTVALLETVRKQISKPANALTALTLIEDILICRYLGHQAESAKSYFIQLWALLRLPLVGKPALLPRIWKT